MLMHDLGFAVDGLDDRGVHRLIRILNSLVLEALVGCVHRDGNRPTLQYLDAVHADQRHLLHLHVILHEQIDDCGRLDGVARWPHEDVFRRVEPSKECLPALSDLERRDTVVVLVVIHKKGMDDILRQRTVVCVAVTAAAVAAAVVVVGTVRSCRS